VRRGKARQREISRLRIRSARNDKRAGLPLFVIPSDMPVRLGPRNLSLLTSAAMAKKQRHNYRCDGARPDSKRFLDSAFAPLEMTMSWAGAAAQSDGCSPFAVRSAPPTGRRLQEQAEAEGDKCESLQPRYGFEQRFVIAGVANCGVQLL
jgi:hypothetical protein